MLIFNNQFSLDLEISKRDFIDKLISISKIQDNIQQDFIPSGAYKYIGTLDFNNFRLTKNKSAIFNKNYTISGQIVDKDEKVQIKGKITGYLVGLVFVLTFTIFCYSIVLYNWISNQSDSYIIPFLIFGFIGLLNIIGLFIGLNRFKNNFIRDISFTKTQMPKG